MQKQILTAVEEAACLWPTPTARLAGGEGDPRMVATSPHDRSTRSARPALLCSLATTTPRIFTVTPSGTGPRAARRDTRAMATPRAWRAPGGLRGRRTFATRRHGACRQSDMT